MTLGDVFSEKLTPLDSSKIKKTINKNKISTNNIRNTKLENVLKNLIYPVDTSGQSQYADLINFTADNYVDIILDRLSKVNLNTIENSAISQSSNVEGKPTERISFKLKGLIKEINSKLEILLENPTSAADEKIQKINENLKQINNVVQSIKESYNNTKTFLTYKDDNFKTLRSYLSILESYAELLRVTPSSKQLGDAFEDTLKMAIENEVNKGVGNLFDQANMQVSGAKKFGNIGVPRTANTGGVNLTITLDYSALSDIDEDSKKIYSSMEKRGKGYTILYTPIQDKWSKMDVEIFFNDNNTAKLSLKNWANIISSNESFGLGETNILGALIRSAGLNSSQNYSLALLSNSSSILNSAHNFAKLSIAADILMGISQKDNWASDLVINDRSEKCIYVYNIPSLLNDIEKNLNITGYNGSYLGSISHNILKNIKVRENRTNKYIQNMFGLLKSKMVSVKLSSGALPKKN